MQRLLIQQVFQGWKEGEPFPPLQSVRPKAKKGEGVAALEGSIYPGIQA